MIHPLLAELKKNYKSSVLCSQHRKFSLSASSDQENPLFFKKKQAFSSPTRHTEAKKDRYFEINMLIKQLYCLSNGVIMKYSFKNPLLISLLASTLGTVAFIFPTYAMEPQEDEKLKKVVPQKQKLVFKTMLDANKYSQILFNLAQRGHFQAVLDSEDQRFIMPKHLSIEDASTFWFHRLCALSQSYHHLGSTSINAKEAKEYFLKAYNLMREYLDSPFYGEQVISQHPEVNTTFQNHRTFVHTLAAKALFSHAQRSLKAAMNPGETKEIENFLLLASQHLRKSIHWAEQCGLPFVEQKKDLFACLLCVSPLCTKEKQKGVHKEIKKIQKELGFKLNSQQNLLSQKEEQLLDNISNPHAKSKKVKAIQKKKMDEIVHHLNQTKKNSPENAHDSDPLHLNFKIVEQNHGLIFLSQNNPDDPSLVPLLHKIEEDIREGLTNANRPSSLFDIYHHYEELLGEGLLKYQLISNILPLLVHVGDLEDAFERAIILKKLDEKNFGKASFYTLYCCADIKNRLGNLDDLHKILQQMDEEPATLEAMAEELEAMQKKKEEQKVSAKAKQEENIVKQIKKQQEIVASQATPPKNNNGSTPQKSVKKPDESQDNLMNFEWNFGESSSTVAEKEEKQERHKIAEKQRSQNAEQERTRLKIPSTLTPKEEMESPIHSPSVEEIVNALTPAELLGQLNDIYDFKGVAATVCVEIENGTWNFTRDQGTQFFCEGLDCSAPTGTKHRKIPLPDIISYGGVPVVMLGGAFILPRWDASERKGTVPDYLRKQMLNGLRRILITHLKAQTMRDK